MNCEHPSVLLQSVNELLSAALFTKTARDEDSKKRIGPVNTGDFHFPKMIYSPPKSPPRGRCEQVGRRKKGEGKHRRHAAAYLFLHLSPCTYCISSRGRTADVQPIWLNSLNEKIKPKKNQLPRKNREGPKRVWRCSPAPGIAARSHGENCRI